MVEKSTMMSHLKSQSSIFLDAIASLDSVLSVSQLAGQSVGHTFLNLESGEVIQDLSYSNLSKHDEIYVIAYHHEIQDYLTEKCQLFRCSSIS